MPAGWAALAAAVIGAGASVYASNKQSSAAKDAAKLNQDQYSANVNMQQPYINSGYGALNKLNTLMGINADPNAPPMVENQVVAPNNISWNGPKQMLTNTEAPQRQYVTDPRQGATSQSVNPQLRQILQIRADNGDPQAKQLLGMTQ